MRSLLIGLAAGIAVFLLVALTTKAGYAFLPAFAATLGVYFVLARRFGKKVEALMEEAGREVQAQRLPNAVQVLRRGYRYAPWVFLMKAQLDGQVGAFLYLEKKFDEAQPLLDAAWSRHWVAKAMLSAYWFRKHKPKQAFKVLDKAMSASKKEPMLYGLKAFMQVKLKDRDGARATLVKGTDILDKNEPLKENLIRLQNGEELRMYLFGDAWWQFHLQKPSQRTLMKLAGGGAGQLPQKGAKKAMYR
jgi:hypothetical protein